MNRFRSSILMALAAAVVACDDATSVGPPASGALSVVLSGARSEQYEARGAQPSAGQGPVTFASGLESRLGGGNYLVSGFRARDGDRQDQLSLELSGVTGPGSYAAAGNLVLGSAGNVALPDRVYRIASGTVRVTALSRSRITGEFSGEAVGGAFPSSFPPPSDTVRFSGGTFDVPIIRR